MDLESIKAAAKTAAAGMLQYYTGNRPGDVPGNIPDPYYWWEAGAMFGAMVEYWYYTGDGKWNEITTQALLHQVGDDNNYMPQNQTLSLGNDDQIFWGFAAMSAAELKYPDPPKGQPQWLSLVQNVFNSQATRWDNSACGGGLHWQAFEYNKGWSYKNTIANGGLFNVAARLARYTGNNTFTDWANKIWDWTAAVGFIGEEYHIFDGADISTNCSVINHEQHAYLPAVYLHGAANMYNITDGSDVWRERIEGIISALGTFFPNNQDIMAQPCETVKCDLNSRSFKAYLARFMGATIPLAPFTDELLRSKIQTSALAAAEQCNGPDNACGLIWTDHTNYKSTTGIGEQMAALEIFKANLVHRVKPPVTEKTGGTSKGNKGTGEDDGLENTEQNDVRTRTIGSGEKAGAGILTMLGVLIPIGAAVFMFKVI
ncbi:Six-hairpin glycosidase [Penicillium griseofulvum]|uniref:Mannan endo-1,6-alpha-mannosidase n=1 Tax=Penicillium patulum TaxID=5078 RepID=A0A135LZA4_PENPA|nr:Six-hairpin glycosidase [Penicillium griseofulvum]KXG54292.1 Six-hairpin glycosidase [Penicillium griseofulvum]